MPTNESKLIKRHKNPIGIFLRILIYPMIAYGIWSRNIWLVAIGILMEILNWTLMPPVEQTFSFIQTVVDSELRWLNAQNGWLKRGSISLLVLSIFLVIVGLWLHAANFIVIGFICLIGFNLLMNKIGKTN